MMIIMPMAGAGSRLGHHPDCRPKPLVTVAGRPMMAWAMDSVADLHCDLFIAVVQQDHERFDIGATIKALWKHSPAQIVTLTASTQGQLCSVLAARSLFTGTDLLIASADTLVRSSLRDDLARARCDGLTGLISVARLLGDHWSFVRSDRSGRVTAVAEKRRISDLASTGIYWFASGHEFLSRADLLINDGERTNGEFYVIPVYRRYLNDRLAIGVSIADEVIDMGNPAALATARRRLGRVRNRYRESQRGVATSLPLEE